MLKEALALDVNTNPHMIEDQKSRGDAMNSLASYYFLLYELETQKVTQPELTQLEAASTVSPTEVTQAQQEQSQKAQKYFQEATRLSNEMGRLVYDIQGHITMCFTYLIKGEL